MKHHAQDGLPARPSGEWAREKLDYVGAYLQVVPQAVGKKWRHNIVFLDLMAGPGLCVLEHGGDEFAGSPLLAMAVAPIGYVRIVLIEAEASLAAALRARTGDDVRVAVIEGDCNQADVLHEAVSLIPPQALAVAFIDNLGTTVPLATLRTLTRLHRKVDLLVTFPSIDLQRNCDAALKDDPAHGPRFDAFFGDAGWRGVVPQGNWRSVVDRLEAYYVVKLKGLGYPHATTSPQAMRNSRNRELYRLVLASGDPLAVGLFDRVAPYTPTAKARLF